MAVIKIYSNKSFYFEERETILWISRQKQTGLKLSQKYSLFKNKGKYVQDLRKRNFAPMILYQTNSFINYKVQSINFTICI